MPVQLAATINGAPVTARVSDDRLLCDFLREDLALTGTRVGCNEGVCGTCTVLVDGQETRSCLVLAAQVDGCEVLTVEGLAPVTHGTQDRELHPLQRAFIEQGAVQCGFCTSGMLMTAAALLAAQPDPTESEIRMALAGNLCRCTGYDALVVAVQMAAVQIAAAQMGDAP